MKRTPPGYHPFELQIDVDLTARCGHVFTEETAGSPKYADVGSLCWQTRGGIAHMTYRDRAIEAFKVATYADPEGFLTKILLEAMDANTGPEITTAYDPTGAIREIHIPDDPPELETTHPVAFGTTVKLNGESYVRQSDRWSQHVKVSLSDEAQRLLDEIKADVHALLDTPFGKDRRLARLNDPGLEDFTGWLEQHYPGSDVAILMRETVRSQRVRPVDVYEAAMEALTSGDDFWSKNLSSDARGRMARAITDYARKRAGVADEGPRPDRRRDLPVTVFAIEGAYDEVHRAVLDALGPDGVYYLTGPAPRRVADRVVSRLRETVGSEGLRVYTATEVAQLIRTQVLDGHREDVCSISGRATRLAARLEKEDRRGAHAG